MYRQRVHFRVCGHVAEWIFSLIELRLDSQPRSRSRVAYQVDNRLECAQGLVAPVASDVTE